MQDWKMVGAVRFELTTSCTRNKRATRLRYAPTQGRILGPSNDEESTMIFLRTILRNVHRTVRTSGFQSQPSAYGHPQFLLLACANQLNRHGIFPDHQTTHQYVCVTKGNFRLVV